MKLNKITLVAVALVSLWAVFATLNGQGLFRDSRDAMNEKFKGMDRITELKNADIELETAIKTAKIRQEIRDLDLQFLDNEEEIIRNEARVNELLYGE